MYHFISGYTAKVAGTEMGVTEPQATFSPCFGGPFLVWRPSKYAELLAAKMQQHKANAWLVNTGWSGGAYGVGSRMKLKLTRAIINAIHSGELARAETVRDPVFGFAVPTACPGVPAEILDPAQHLERQGELSTPPPASWRACSATTLRSMPTARVPRCAPPAPSRINAGTPQLRFRGVLMKFMVEFQLKPGRRNKAVEYFELRGPNRNPGVTLQGCVDRHARRRRRLCSSKARTNRCVASAGQAWSEFGDYEIHPVIDIEQY